MRRARGVYIHPENIGAIDQIFRNVPLPHVQLMVVTDGERILGLGDLGADGMGIPVGKVSLYVAAGGIHPACCLPVCLDVGTNNERLLNDPLYLGYRHPRITGQRYDDFIERFVLGVQRSFPGALIQWEDFAKHNAFRLLARYRDRVLSFDDDIQGTGAVACASLLTASRIQKVPLKEQRFVIVGFGQAGVGTAMNIEAVLVDGGLSTTEARRRIFAIDQQGLLLEGDPALAEEQVPYAQPRDAVAGWELADASRIFLKDVLRNARPGVLVGFTAVRGLFDAEVLEQIGRNAERPVILALSNPTSRSECTPEEALRGTGGRALVANGSPFPAVEYEGRKIPTSQCNNLYMFPGVGLGALAAKAAKVTDRMFVAAAQALSGLVTLPQEEAGLLLPPMKRIRDVAAVVAKAVAIEARDSGLGRLLSDDEIEATVRRAQWQPGIVPYRPGLLPR